MGEQLRDIIKHFSECAGAIVELKRVSWADTREFASIIGRPRRDDEKLTREGRLFAYGICPNCGRRHASARRIYFSASPSEHVCNAKCMGATGSNCECSCGGKNHGAGFAESLFLFDAA